MTPLVRTLRLAATVCVGLISCGVGFVLLTAAAYGSPQSASEHTETFVVGVCCWVLLLAGGGCVAIGLSRARLLEYLIGWLALVVVVLGGIILL